jgi:16S rRNA (adenine(1408)-N(1))-methyltransferase
MAEASRRAASARRGGQPNVRFVAAAAETPPVELIGQAHLVTINLPWGSLLRGVLGQDAAVLSGIAMLLASRGRIEALVSLEPRDVPGGRLEQASLASAALAWQRCGLSISEMAAATSADVRATGSSWGRRLLTNPDRRFWRLRASRVSASLRG